MYFTCSSFLSVQETTLPLYKGGNHVTFPMLQCFTLQKQQLLLILDEFCCLACVTIYNVTISCIMDFNFPVLVASQHIKFVTLMPRPVGGGAGMLKR